MKASITLACAACALCACQPRYGFDVMNRSAVPVRVECTNGHTNHHRIDGFRADLSPNARLRWRTGKPGPPREQYEIRILSAGSGQALAQCQFVSHTGTPTVYAVRDAGGAWSIEEVSEE